MICMLSVLKKGEENILTIIEHFHSATSPSGITTSPAWAFQEPHFKRLEGKSRGAGDGEWWVGKQTDALDYLFFHEGISSSTVVVESKMYLSHYHKAI